MMEDKTTSQTNMMTLWGIEEDLPSLACHAAVELDNLILNKSKNLDAVLKLTEVISNLGLISNQGQQTNGQLLAHLNPATAVAFNGAISDSKLAMSLTTVQEIMKEADQITQRLKSLFDNPQKAGEEGIEETKKLRSFCLALSKRSLANDPPLYDLIPEHPHRR